MLQLTIVLWQWEGRSYLGTHQEWLRTAYFARNNKKF